MKKLRDVLTIKNGKDYKSFGSGNIPVYGTGGILTYINTFAYSKPSVLIPRKGSLDKLYYVDQPFWTVDTLFYTEIDETKVLPKFVYYYLSGLNLERLNRAGGIPSLTQTQLNNIKFPDISLSEQSRIVKVLDSFLDLIDTLKSELVLRQKQFEYYNDYIYARLKQNYGLQPVKKIADYFFRGKGINKKSLTNDGEMALHYTQIYTDFDYYFKNSKHKVNPSLIKNPIKIKKGDVLFAISSVQLKNLGKAIAYLGDKKCIISGDIIGFSHRENPLFLSFMLGTDEVRKQKLKGKIQSTVVHTNQTEIEKLKIPLPPLKIQNHIANNLKVFLDFTELLQEEIDLRQKQYEYYRDILLDFDL